MAAVPNKQVIKNNVKEHSANGKQRRNQTGKKKITQGKKENVVYATSVDFSCRISV